MGDRVWLPASGRARHDSEGFRGKCCLPHDPHPLPAHQVLQSLTDRLG
ncbi:MAG UNVERIFIED_CONTAM: hypothetical protein LVT10_01600 [Anaerolineae bacterium]